MRGIFFKGSLNIDDFNSEFNFEMNSDFDGYDEPYSKEDDLSEEYDADKEKTGYKLKVDQIKNMSREQMRQMVDDFHSGDPERRRNAIMTAVRGLNAYIYSLIHTKYKTYEAKLAEDLEQAAYTGVIAGLEKFNPEKGKLTTWFDRYIRHEMNNVINREHNSTPYYQQQMKKIEDVLERYEKAGRIGENGPTYADISLESGVPVKTIDKCIRMKIANNSLPFESENVETVNLKANIPTPEDAMLQKERQEFFQKIFGENSEFSHLLTPEEKECIQYRYGFITGSPEGISEISRITGIPKQNIRKMIETGTNKLKDPVRKFVNPRKKIYKPSRNKIAIKIISRIEMDDMEDDLSSSFDD